MRANKKFIVYDEILDRLISMRYRFGERILVKEVGAETGASRQPIMAALNALSADGFVKIIPQVGCEVVSPTPRDIADFYLMFARTEGVLAELAAERRTPAQLRGLKDLNQLIRRDLGDSGGSGYRELNQSFHKLFHQMAASPLLDAKQSSIFAMSDFFIMQTVGFTPHVDEATNEHDAIIAAIEQGDGKAARATAEQHIDEVARTVLSAAQEALVA